MENNIDWEVVLNAVLHPFEVKTSLSVVEEKQIVRFDFSFQGRSLESSWANRLPFMTVSYGKDVINCEQKAAKFVLVNIFHKGMMISNHTEAITKLITHHDDQTT